jgi:CHAT domain-containing protein
MNEMFRRGRTTVLGEALGQSQELLMDDADTSHPYYWAGFALIGDAAKPLLGNPEPQQIARNTTTAR